MINMERLKAGINKLTSIGLNENDGHTRLALSEEDKKARKLLVTFIEDLGLVVRVDDFGNIYGTKKGSDPSLAPIMLGSHIDTVPDGGKFDGVLGVLGALEAIESFIETGKPHRRPIELVAFTNEEGSRFTPQMLGSGAVTGKFSKEYVYKRVDNEERNFADELQTIGFMGEDRDRLKKVQNFIELHIEQGPVLDEENISIGVVEGIAGFSWFEITVKGESNHSGTTPMKNRSDSLVSAAALIQELNRWANKKEDGTVLTVGKINAQPGSVNVIPASTIFTVDVRIYDSAVFESTLSELKQLIDDKVQALDTEYELTEIKTQKPVAFSPQLVNLIEKESKEQKYSYTKMKSGAGHDAMYMNEITDTAMIFVPSINGISHSPEECTSWEDIEKGVNVLYGVMERLVE